MNPTGWYYAKADGVGDNPPAPTANFQKLDIDFKAKHLKVKTATSLQLSFDGKTTHASVVAADGLVHFEDVNKGEIHYKGSGTAEITAWDGN